MKKLILLSSIAITLGLFQACKSKTSTTTITDSTTVVNDTTKKDTMMMAANPDTSFATKAAGGGMAEVALGKMALSKTTNASIKSFANMMVTDHSKANDELMGIAKTKKITLPMGPDAGHQAKMDSLSKLTGAGFDKAYVALMIEGHQKTLSLMQDEAQNGKDADLKAFAAKTATTVQMHLDAINKINSSMK